MNRTRMRQIALFVGLYVVVLSLPALVAIVGRDWLEQLLASLWWFVPVALLALLATIAPLLYLTVIRRMEGQLLTAQRRYHRTLISASSGMIRIKDIKTLCRLIVHVLNRTVALTHTGLFLYDPNEQQYFLRAVRHQNMFPSEFTMMGDDPLCQVLRERKDLLVLDELQAEVHMKRADEQTKQLASVYSWMRKLEAKIIVPAFSGERLLAFFVLGAKRSGEPYTSDDISLFSGLANQAALAIENAMVFEELRANEAYMLQSEKLASLGQLASGMAHEIHNPLTIISGEAQLYLERFQGQSGEVDEVLKSIIEECHRAADITRRILRFAKPSARDVGPVDLKTAVQDSLTLAGYQVKMEQVERTVAIPPDLPQVASNHTQLQEVLLNLILNACQAMAQKGGTLSLEATCVNSQVQITVRDTGPGIPANRLKKIFDPFYTTKSTGTGLGLFVSQRIIRSHGGTMSVESEEAKGTCFTVSLPVWREDPASASTNAPG